MQELYTQIRYGENGEQVTLRKQFIESDYDL